MKSTRRYWILGIVILVVVLVAVLVAHNFKKNEPKQDSTIHAAAILGVTGPASLDSEEIKRGIELAQADLAKEGIILDMTIEDDNTNPVKTVTAFQKILTTQRPAFLIGPVWSFLGNAIAGQIAEEHIPTYQPANTSEFITSNDFGPLFFGFPKISSKQALTEQFLRDHQIKTVLIATDSDTWGIAHKAMYEKAARNVGVTIIGNEVLVPGDVSVINPLLSKYRNNQPDAILLSDGYDSVDNVFMKRYIQYGYRSYVLGDKSMLARDNKDMALKIGKISILVLVPSPEFVSKYKEKYGVDPNPYADSAYDGVMMMVQAIREVGTDSSAIISYLKNPSLKYKGYQTTYAFDENGDMVGSLWKLKEIQ